MKRFISVILTIIMLLSINFAVVNAQGNPGKYVVKSDRAAQIYQDHNADISLLVPAANAAPIPANTEIEVLDVKDNMGQISKPADGWVLIDDLDPVPAQPAGFQPTAVTGWQKIDPSTFTAVAGEGMYPGITGKVASDNDGSYDFSNMPVGQIALVFGGHATFDDPANPNVPVTVGTDDDACFVALIMPTYNGKVKFAPRDAMVEIFTVDLKFDPMLALAQKHADLVATYAACREVKGRNVAVDVRLYTNASAMLTAAAIPLGWESNPTFDIVPNSKAEIVGYGDLVKGPIPLPSNLNVPVGQFAVVYGEVAKIAEIEMGMPNLCYLAIINGDGNDIAVASSEGSMVEFYSASVGLDLHLVAAWHQSIRIQQNEATCGKHTDTYIKN